jgi:hypothetical protein
MNDWTVDYVMSFITWNNVLGATGALFYIISMSMKTVIPLRITSLVSALCLLGASLLARSLPAIALYALLLPVHSFRLYQMLALIKKVRIASGTDLSMDWLPTCNGGNIARATFSFTRATLPTKCSWPRLEHTACSDGTSILGPARSSASSDC